MLSVGCQDCSRGRIGPNEQLHGIVMQHEGIPNVGNTCYMNAVLQIIARCYPNTFSQQGNDLERCGQAIVDKLTSNESEEPVTQEEAKAFFDALKNSYNQGKPNKEQLSSGQQEDAAPVLNFLLHQGNIQEIEFYTTTRHPNGTYETTTASSPTTGQCIIVTPASTEETSMDKLVENTFRGNSTDTDDVNRSNSHESQVAVNRLSNKNLCALTNGILPIWVLRSGQTSDSDPSTARKITILIKDPFYLTIAENYLRERELYKGTLMGFIHHYGSIHSGHYTAYVKNKAGKWVEYNDSRVMVLDKEPSQKAQEAYLYFYQAD